MPSKERSLAGRTGLEPDQNGPVRASIEADSEANSGACGSLRSGAGCPQAAPLEPQWRRLLILLTTFALLLGAAWSRCGSPSRERGGET